LDTVYFEYQIAAT